MTPKLRTYKHQLLRTVAGPKVAELGAELQSQLIYAVRHRASRGALWALRDRHVGERCFIIGNGPSLNQTDLSLLRSEFTFGLNRINLAFERLGFATSCLVCFNRYVLEQSGAELSAVSVPKFFSAAGARFIPPNASDVIYVRPAIPARFSHNPVKAGVWEGATVTFVAMQLAYWFGFRQVILIGVDHSFTATGPAHTLVTAEGPDPNHFDPNYFSKGYRWQLPDLETSEIAYTIARRTFADAGGEILDATVGGKLTVFQKVRLETLF